MVFSSSNSSYHSNRKKVLSSICIIIAAFGNNECVNLIKQEKENNNPCRFFSSYPGFTAVALTIRPGFHFYNRHQHKASKTNSTSSSSRNFLKYINGHAGIFARTKKKFEGMIMSASTDSSNFSISEPPKKSVHLELESETMKRSMRHFSNSGEDKSHQRDNPTFKESSEECENKNDDAFDSEDVDNSDRDITPQTITLYSYTDPVSNITLQGLNIPRRKFHAWVDHTLLTIRLSEKNVNSAKKNRIHSQSKQRNSIMPSLDSLQSRIPILDNKAAQKSAGSNKNNNLNIKIKREDPPILDKDKVVTEEIHMDDEKVRSHLRKVWRERRLVSERTEMLATYASDRANSKVLQQGDDSKDKQKYDGNNLSRKRGGFSDLLQTYADRLLAIVKDEQDDFDLGGQIQLENDSKSIGVEDNVEPLSTEEGKSNSILRSGGLLEWIKREYGEEETMELSCRNLQYKNEAEQFKSIQKFLDWFRDCFPYYYDRCDSCQFSLKENPPQPPENDNTDELSSNLAPEHEDKNGEDEDDEMIDNDRSAFLGYVYPNDEELKGKATRTEIYWCENCGAFTRFPRFNSASWVVHKSRGRCGEYSMLLFRMLRVLGFESRWVVDWADHVWAEVKIKGRWVHADPCEAALDNPLLYQEWGKQQNYIVAFNAPSLDFFNFERNEQNIEKNKNMNISSIWEQLSPLVEDVTSTYTSDTMNDIQNRRDESSSVIETSIMKVNSILKDKLYGLREKRLE